ncbi:DUF397 domain-containing protein [Nocardia seriolae]|nr:DUF397 domain-containing protein [Nocardia seriolae]
MSIRPKHAGSRAATAAPMPTVVEAAHVGGGAVAVRDSKLADASPVLVFAPGDWDRFADAVKSGKFDLA